MRWWQSQLGSRVAAYPSMLSLNQSCPDSVSYLSGCLRQQLMGLLFSLRERSPLSLFIVAYQQAFQFKLIVKLFELRKHSNNMERLNSSSEMPLPSGGRRIFNVGGHGAFNVANMSINQRIMDGVDLNASRRYDQHFDSQISHDQSMEHYSSRQNYGTGVNELARDGSLHILKRSETEQFKPSVTFAAGLLNKGNYKGGLMEKIEEHGSQGRSPSTTGKGLTLVPQHENFNKSHSRSTHLVHDSSQISGSHKLEDSIKASGRPPQRITGLTQYLVDQHYKKIGVFTKNENELFKFWKEQISLAYRQHRLETTKKVSSQPDGPFTFDVSLHIKKSNTLSLKQQQQPKRPQSSAAKRTASPTKAGSKANKPKKEISLHNKSPATLRDSTTLQKETTMAHTTPEIMSEKERFEYFSRLYEFDVAFTLEKDMDEENDQVKSSLLKREQEVKAAIEKDQKTKEDAIVKWTIELFYNDLKSYLLAHPDFEPGKEKDLQLVQANFDIEQNFKSQIDGLSSGKQADSSKGAITTLAPQKTIGVQNDENIQPNQASIKPQDDAKKLSEKETYIEKFCKEEKEYLTNLFLMIRDLRVMSNNPNEVARRMREQTEKSRFGIIWPRGDDDATRVIARFFRPECVFRRIQLLYKNKIQTEKKYEHLSLFAFYLQLSKPMRLLHLIDYPYIKSKRLVVPRPDEDRLEEQYSHLKKGLFQPVEKDGRLSLEEICVNYELFGRLCEKRFQSVKAAKLEMEGERERNKRLEQVFGKDKKVALDKKLGEMKAETRIGNLAQPKDKWGRLRILINLRKKFTHDISLQKMIQEELKANKVFKYPEEYELYDDQENAKCRHMADPDVKGLQSKVDFSAGRTLREKFKALDDKDLYYLNKELKEKRREEQGFEKFMAQHALEYLQDQKKRLEGKTETVREFVSKLYQKALEREFKDLVKERFPHLTYGAKKDSETYKKSYPVSFKNFFFQIVKSHFRTQKGFKRMRHPPPGFILVGGKRCILHSEYACPEDCKFGTFNKKVILKHQVLKRRTKEPAGYRSRVWRRHDFKKAIDKVMMLNSEQENCTFEPEAGSMSRTIDQALKANPNLRKEGVFDEADPEAYIKKLGANFEKSHPEVYKAGVLKRAQLMYKQGRFEDALKRLYDGFNVDSVKKRYDPNYFKRLLADSLMKAKAQRKKQEEAKVGTLASLQRVHALQEEPESQKKRPEEDFENKKLIPIFRQAYDLIVTIEARKKNTEDQIARIERQRTKMKKSVRSFSQYKKSQTRLDFTKGEKILYRSIMCPLRDKCPNDIRPRWPTSNTKSITKFGETCPYAHHPMELRFPEQVLTKLSSANQTIKKLREKIDNEKPKEAFKPSGTLYDCVGCNSKSSKHIGGPCNLCRYKEMANISSAQFVDKKRIDSLRRSLDKRESKEEKEDHKEMKDIMKMLDLDGNYTVKFGLLKKACVLFFYGRYNDAFDEVAKAAKIIQDQKEIERQKQTVIERRWKFKLGLDDGFEMPIPLDQIDPAKVDEKFLKKLDLQGVSISTIKLYIQEVAPHGKEDYSKHQFLNKCIEDFYLECESMLEDKQNTIAKMKKQVEKLDEEADMMDGMGSSPERSPEKGGFEKSFKSKKTKMCPNLLKSKVCNLPTNKCPYAHNPIELDLIPVETKMKNLQGVIQSQQQKLKNMKPLEPWKPVKSGEVIHTHLMDMSTKGKKRKGEGEDDDEENERRKEVKKKSIFERENIFRKPYEVNE